MTTYNGGKLIIQQIDSILGQSYSDIELVICDDRSNDETKAILLDYEKKDSRCKVFFNEENLGFKKNFEKAISLCSGEYIALSDQDDVWEPWKLEESLKIIGDKQFVCTNALLIDDSGNSLGYTMKESINYRWIPQDTLSLFKRLVANNFVQGATMLARADFLKAALPIPQEFVFHDCWFALKACTLNGFAYLDKTAVRYRQHTAQITENKKESFIAELHPLEASEKSYQKHFADLDIHLAECRYMLNTFSLSDEQRDYLVKSIRYFEGMKNKSLYTVFFFARYCVYISLDRNILRNLVRIIKRILGYFRWHIQRRKHAVS